MAQSSDKDAECARLLHKLCSVITGLSADAVSPLFEECSHVLGSSPWSHFASSEIDESRVAERINRLFIREHKEKEAVRFSDLHRRLRSPALQGVLQNRALVLAFLLEMKGKGPGGGQSSSGPPSMDAELLPLSLSRPHPPQPVAAATRGREQQRLSFVLTGEPAASLSTSRASSAHELEVVQGVVYSLQGVSSSVVQFCDAPSELIVDPEGVVPSDMRSLTGRLTELGVLVRRIDGFCKNKQARRGLLSDALVGALQTELTEYYRLLALPDGQIQGAGEPADGAARYPLTLHSLTVMMMEPLATLRVLASLVKACQGLKGGMLASRMHAFLAHGDPQVSTLVRRLLVAVLHPWYGMLCRWVQTGQLEDVYHEFFIATNEGVPAESLWHDKYYLRKNMVPSFLSEAQARKILCTGKAVNFLLHVCQDQPTGPLLQDSHLEARTVQSLLEADRDDTFQQFLDQTYQERNRRVLAVLGSQFKLKEHLQALRQFLLLGQGDFVRHLMDVLDEQLSQPAVKLYQHSLSESVAEALRSTNAQFVDPEILERLEIKLLETNPGDVGWDVFSLFYRVDGPIASVFTPYSMSVYLRLFNHLWRAKHMEYVTTAAWKQQTMNRKLWTRDVPECLPVLHQCDILLAEMMHFMQQVQYYMVFEVIECAWAELETRVDQAQDLDEVVKAHDDFLSALMTRALLDPESRDILSELRSIFDQVLRFNEVQERLLTQLEQTRAGGGKQQPRSQRSVISEAQAAVRVISDTYQKLVQGFLVSLSCHDDINLQGLGFRLDFSEFYNLQNHQLRSSMTFQRRRKSLGSTMHL
ncbi:gamma-tubulin complex component 3 [Ixodes scapularis]|uniref:gamma-tubulin complex component 3 n=1 Tax=Ixodes scapularis TaxID=6945 RepID=UPI001C388BB7|nr:gamma-tubulin complex component 3 [Ixodes scapularis]